MVIIWPCLNILVACGPVFFFLFFGGVEYLYLRKATTAVMQ